MDVTSLRELPGLAGPFVSVYFDSSHDTEDAARQIDLRWRAIRDQLGADGAAQETLAALDTAVAEGPPSRGRAGRALVAAGDTVLIDEQLPDPPPTQVVRVSPLPYLLPLIEFGHRRVPHVVVVVDRTGADLRAVDEHGVDRAEREVQGQEHPVHKAGGGGWAHWSIQHRVEEVVHRNVDEVAREASRLVDAVGAKVLVLAGEVQARSALREAIPQRARSIAVEIDAGGRAEGGDPDAFDARVHDVVEANAEDQRRAVLERFRAERDRSDGRAVQGLSETASALRTGAVECLLVDDSALADRMIWVGRGPTQLAATEQQLRASGAGPTGTQRADEALPVAALATGAQIMPAGQEALPDGVGALLRYT